MPSLQDATAPQKLLRRLGWPSQRRGPSPRPNVNPVVVEEEAASLLYGERTGTVHASPVVPPLGEEPDETHSGG
jgi:hypothetical protein